MDYEQIKFESQHLVSTKSGETVYHDDYNGEAVWFNLSRIPHFITSTDFREFNGVKIKDIASFLDFYFSTKWDFEVMYQKMVRKLKDNQ